MNSEQTTRVEIYTSPTCPYCEKAKMLLTKEGISFEEISFTAEEDQLRELLEKRDGAIYNSIPQVFIDGKFIGGFDDLSKLHADGGLQF